MRWGIVALFVVLLLAGLYWQETSQILELIVKTPLWLFAAALIIVTIEGALQILRLWLGLRGSAKEITKSFIVGQFVALSLPLRTLGEGIRVTTLARMLRRKTAEVAAVVAISRILDVAVMITAATLVFTRTNPFIPFVIGVLIVAFFLFMESDRIHAKILERSIPEFVRAYMEKSRKIVKNRRLFAGIFVITVLIWGLDFLRVWIIFRAFEIDVSYAETAAFVAIAYMAGAISLLPGGLGVYEGGLTGALIVNGAEPTTAVAAVLYERFFSYWLWVIVGGTVGTGIRKAQTQSEKEQAEQQE